MSTKYLLNLVDARPRQASHLKALVVEARESGVRDEKASHHEFVETLERITQELRSDPLAVAFLSRVKKTEAPDYYDVIKHPMDLATVLKRVKTGFYKVKAQFKADVDLIWANCFLYNTWKEHPLRQAATTLKTKTNQLLEFVTDPAPLKPAAPARSASHSAASRPLSGLAAAEARWLATKRGGSGAAGAGGARANGVSFADDADSEAEGEEGKDEDAQVAFEDRPALVRTAEGMSRFVETESAWDAGPVAGPSMPRGMVNGDVPSTTSGDSKSRSSRSRSRGRQGVRAASAGARSSTATGTVAGFETEKLVGLLKEDPVLGEWATFLSPSLLTAGIPSLPVRAASSIAISPSAPAAGPSRPNGIAKRPAGKRKTGKGKAKGKAKAKADATAAGGKTLAQQMRTNIAALRRIKRTHGKMAAMTATPQIGGTPDPDFGDDASDADTDAELDPPDLHQKPVRAELMRPSTGGEVAAEAMEDVVSMVLAHAGFDAVQATALHSLTEIATHYLTNLGRTLKFYSDRFPSSTSDPASSPSSASSKDASTASVTLTPTDMIYQTLRVNGVSSLAVLESYLYDDVERYGKRLGDLERKLEKGYKEMMENGVVGARRAWQDEMLFAKDGEAMMMGDFANELGEDFWGMRELGLESELGTASMRIPARLFHGKPKETEPRDVEMATPEEEPRFVQPPPFVPLTSAAVEGQIGLLQPFYRARAQHPDFELLEDDQISKAKLPKLVRPKVPPSGKIPIKRKGPTAAMASHTASPGTAGGTPMAMTASSQGGDLGESSAKKRKKGD